MSVDFYLLRYFARKTRVWYIELYRRKKRVCICTSVYNQRNIRFQIKIIFVLTRFFCAKLPTWVFPPPCAIVYKIVSVSLSLPVARSPFYNSLGNPRNFYCVEDARPPVNRDTSNDSPRRFVENRLKRKPAAVSLASANSSYDIDRSPNARSYNIIEHFELFFVTTEQYKR